MDGGPPTCPTCGAVLRCPRCDSNTPDPHDRAAWSDAMLAAELREATGDGRGDQ